MDTYDPLFTPLNALYKAAEDEILKALNLISTDFPSHPREKVYAFVKHAWDRVNSPGHHAPHEQFFRAEIVGASYRAAHPNEKPAPASAPAPVANNGSEDLIYDFD